MSHSNSSSQHILISFSEYERLKNIETEFEKLQKEQHQKLQIPSTYFFTQFPFLRKEYIYNMSITNYELIDLCKFYKIPTNGVYMKDELKNINLVKVRVNKSLNS